MLSFNVPAIENLNNAKIWHTDWGVHNHYEKINEVESLILGPHSQRASVAASSPHKIRGFLDLCPRKLVRNMMKNLRTHTCMFHSGNMLYACP
jgi:hypothetical protein